MAALAGCTGDETDINAEIHSMPDEDDDEGTVMLSIDVSDPPIDVEIVVRAVDENGETLEEFSDERTLDDEENIEGIGVQDLPEETDGFEFEVEMV